MTTALLSRVESRANEALDSLRTLSGKVILSGITGADLLHERAALMQWQAHGQVSANGSCHLLQTTDGWIAINLSRESDWQLLPALFTQDITINTAEQLQAQLYTHSAQKIVERGAMLGLAIAEATRSPPASPINNHTVLGHGSKQTAPHDATHIAANAVPRATPRVLDLSSLWAGPLCSQLLRLAGAEVVEVHNVARPDGMALNPAPTAQEFYRRLHESKEILTLDFRRYADMQHLRTLISEADIVIEASRPRALQQLGIDAEKYIAQHPGLIWVSITGYGRNGDNANRIAFGDDAAVGAGLFDECDGKPVFIGDAIADPLTGLHAALAAFTHWQRGESALLNANLHTVAAWSARP